MKLKLINIYKKEIYNLFKNKNIEKDRIIFLNILSFLLKTKVAEYHKKKKIKSHNKRI